MIYNIDTDNICVVSEETGYNAAAAAPCFSRLTLLIR